MFVDCFLYLTQMGPTLPLLQHHSIFILDIVLVILDEKEGVTGIVDGRYGVVTCDEATQHSYFDEQFSRRGYREL